MNHLELSPGAAEVDVYRPQEPKTLFVANFDDDVDEDDLERLFNKYGEVLGAQIPLNRDTGNSRGFGFVTMITDDAAENARECLNGKLWRRRRLTVKNAWSQK